MLAAAITGNWPAPSGGGGRIFVLDARDLALDNGVDARDEARDDPLEEGLLAVMTTLFHPLQC